MLLRHCLTSMIDPLGQNSLIFQPLIKQFNWGKCLNFVLLSCFYHICNPSAEALGLPLIILTLFALTAS